MLTKLGASLITISILSLSGCSAKYVAPASDQMAYIQVVNQNGEPDKQAFISTYQEASNCKQRLWLQQGAYIPGDITTSFEKIAAKKQISISILGTAFDRNCVSTFSFVPESSRYYRAKKNGCNTVLLESSATNDFKSTQREKVLIMDFKQAMSESGSWCSVSPLNDLAK